MLKSLLRWRDLLRQPPGRRPWNAISRSRPQEGETDPSGAPSRPPVAVLLARISAAFPLDWTVEFTNAGVTALAGYTPAELAGRPLRTLCAEEAPEGALGRLLRCGETRLRLRHQNGAAVPVWVQVLPIAGAQGRRTHVLIFVAPDLAVETLPPGDVADVVGQAFEQSPGGLAITDIHGRILHVNRCFCDLMGYSSAELRGQECLSIVRPEDAEPLLGVHARALAGEPVPSTLEVRCRRKDGTWLPVSLRFCVIRDGGHPRALCAVVENLTRSRAAREHLRASEERFQQIVETAAEGICTLDAESRITFVNRRLAEMLGSTPEAMVGRPATEFMPADEFADSRLRAATLRFQPTLAPYLRCLRHATGGTLWVSISACALRAPDGSFAGILALLTDVTASRAAEEALRTTEERLRRAQSEAAVAVWEWDLQSGIVSASEQMAALFDLPPDRMPRYMAGWVERIHPQDRQRVARSVGSDVGDRGYELECRVLRPDGSVRWLLSRGRVICDRDGVPRRRAGVVVDVTQLKQAQEALVESEERLKIAQAAGGVSTWELDLRDRRLLFSAQFAQLYGREPDPAGSSYAAWLELLHPEDRLRVDREIQQAAAAGGAFHSEFRALWPDGSVRWLISKGRVFAAAGRRPAHMIGASIDVTERVLAEETVRVSEARFRTAFAGAAAGIALIDTSRRIFFANSAFGAISGYPENELLSLDLLAITHAEDAPVIRACLADLLAGREPSFVTEKRYLRKDGSIVWARNSISAVPDSRGVVSHAVVLAEDVTDRKLAEDALHHSEERFRHIFEHSPIGMLLIDFLGRLLKVNPSICLLLGYLEDELMQLTSQALTHPEDLGHDLDQWHRLVRREIPNYSIEKRYIRRDGSIMWGRKTCSPICSPAGEFLYSVTVVEDITQRKAAEEQLAYQAQHDVLTGLPNRRLLMDRIQQAIGRGRRGGTIVALYYIDLDSFKLVNDSLGHATGDDLLQQVAIRLRSAVRETDTLARSGGDEFVLVATELRDARSAKLVAEKLRNALKQPFHIGSHDLFVTASIGISLFPGDGPDAESLQRNADAAMYHAKRLGKNGIRFFSPDMSRVIVERLRLEGQLRRALEQRQLWLVHQPQFRLSDRRLLGYETLLRWTHPELGAVPPSKFIPVAEETGLIVPIGTWVMREACRQLRRWKECGRTDLRLSINVSEIQFGRSGFAKLVRQVLDEEGVDPRWLELELTESIVIHDFEASARRMAELRAMGVTIAIDDFGTGYSSLSYLQRLPIDVLKIDGSFVRGIGRNDTALPVLSSLVSMCHSLNMKVLVEGVETTQQLDALVSIGCDAAQGFLLGVPGPLE